MSFREFVDLVRPGYQWYRHCVELADVLQRVADGEVSRLMVFMAPRHGKSELVSRLFSAYYLYRYPERWVGMNSYGADLAYTLSRSSRENFIRGGGSTAGDAAAVKHWGTGAGGGLWAAGVGGPITGKGFHLGIIDDPVKNAEEAASERIQARHQEWYQSTFSTRAEPDAAVIVIQTRWNEADLGGWLLAEEAGDDPERWYVVSLPAVSEVDSVDSVDGERRRAAGVPSTCTLHPDWRAVGEALCPERYALERLRKIRARIGDYFFEALYQQRPSPKAGEMFKVANLRIVDAAPAGLRRCRAWDLAGTEGGGANTAGVLMGVDRERTFYVEDVVLGQWADEEVDARIQQTARVDGDTVRIRLPQDPGSAGKKVARLMVRMMAGYDVRAEPVTGSKETRARPYASQVNSGNVCLVRGPWNRAYIEELRQAPRGKFKDQMDASSDAFTELALEPDGIEADDILIVRR